MSLFRSQQGSALARNRNLVQSPHDISHIVDRDDRRLIQQVILSARPGILLGKSDQFPFWLARVIVDILYLLTEELSRDHIPGIVTFLPDFMLLTL